MSDAGSTFTDWQQVERDSLLFVDDDFNWSEPPQRRRRRMTGSANPGRTSAADEIYAERRGAVLEYQPEPRDEYGSRSDYESYAERPAPEQARSWDHPTAVHSHFDEMMEEWNAAYGDGPGRDLDDRASERAFDLSDPGHQAGTQGARRTVLITGRGDDRYLPAPRQRSASELRFHERSSFSPDRAGLWAVLLGIALVIGCIAH